MNRINRMNKAEVLQTLVKVAKLQENLLNKLASGEADVSFESFDDFENAVKERIVDESENLEQELDSMETYDIKEAVNNIVDEVDNLFGKDNSALKTALKALSPDQIGEILDNQLFLKVKNIVIFNANNELKGARRRDLGEKLDELRQLVSLTLEQLKDLIKKNSNYVDTSKTLECRDCGHLNPLKAKKCVECNASLTKANMGEDMEGDELPVYNPRPPAADEDEEDEEDEEDNMRR